MAQQEIKAMRHKNQVYFKSPEMDFTLQWFLGYQAYGGSALGEMLYAASRINEKDLNSWAEEWRALAERVEAQAAASLARQHTVSACEGYLRAFTYHRLATNAMFPTDPRYEPAVRKFSECFAQAAKLMTSPLEPVRIPFEGKALPGYFARAGGTGEKQGSPKRPTLIVIGGGETYHQDLYFWGGAAALRRGYNALMIDMPGQGATAFSGLHYRVDFETPMRAVVDYLLQQPEVDPDRIAAVGVSLGGYIVLRAVTREKRIRACAVSTPIVDAYRMFTSALPAIFKLNHTLMDLTAQMLRGFDPVSVVAIQRSIWQLGYEKVSEGLESLKTWKVDARQISCPTLCIVGEGEDASFKFETDECYRLLEAPKTLRRFTVEEGADGHCQANNFNLAHSVLFDWLDEVMAYQPA